MLEIINIPLLLLIISAVLIIGLLIYVLNKKNKTQLQIFFSGDLICVAIICVGVMLQDIYSQWNLIDPWIFEKYIYIGTCFLPVCIFFTGLVFARTKITFKRYYLLLFIIPIISLIVLWTNQYHHLFYKTYSYVYLNDSQKGPYMMIHNIYSYLMLLIGILYMLKAATRNSGFFSKQSLLIVIGISVPLVANILGTLKVIPMTVYVTPIGFAFTMICLAFAIFKFKFLGIAPIALRIIVDRISDSYLILNEEYNITDFNITLLNTFNIKDDDIRNKNITKIINDHKEYNISKSKLESVLKSIENSKKKVVSEQYIKQLNKYFTIEINTIYNKENFLGILILLKDITQHKLDMKTIEDNQGVLMEQERLASLGQMIGGISHNLKTPIMSISGAAEGISDLVKELDASIGDPQVTNEDFHAIASDMREWITKIHTYTSYMSDVITAVKGQAVNLSDIEEDIFTIDELIKRVTILMNNELKSAHVSLKVNLNNFNTIKIHGNVNSLVQVINNLITNAIQSYRDNPGSIELSIAKKTNNVIIEVLDHGCGMPKDVQEKLFKEMITTKGKKGTGLGMFMSYSTIKGNFNGNITFETKEGEGTKFDISIPINK